jgi:hypothetical protein
MLLAQPALVHAFLTEFGAPPNAAAASGKVMPD